MIVHYLTSHIIEQGMNNGLDSTSRCESLKQNKFLFLIARVTHYSRMLKNTEYLLKLGYI